MLAGGYHLEEAGMNKNEANQLLASIVDSLEDGTLFVEDLGKENVARLLRWTRSRIVIDLADAENKGHIIEEMLKEVVGPHLHPANRFMQELQRVHPEDWDVAIEESLRDDGDEIQQYWIIHDERLQSLMIECGCKFIQLEEIYIWCNPSSERFGLLAMDKLGKLLLDGIYDRHFI
jgi:hypothetical protein